ncbi:MAG: hypothetical protein KJ676_05265 [Alphaproteobacteria bacterium]|nr:hypothetical protein [Alphaproteobacteria bacterium]
MRHDARRNTLHAGAIRREVRPGEDVAEVAPRHRDALLPFDVAPAGER